MKIIILFDRKKSQNESYSNIDTVLGDFTIEKLAEFVFQTKALAQLSYYDVNMQKCYMD